MNGMRSSVRRRAAVGLGLVAISTLVLAGCAEGGGEEADSGSVEGETRPDLRWHHRHRGREHAEVLRQVHRRHRHHRRVHRRQGLRGQHRHEGAGRRRPRHRDRPAARSAADARRHRRGRRSARGRRGERRRELVARTGRPTAPSTTCSTPRRCWPTSRATSGTRPRSFEEWGVEVPEDLGRAAHAHRRRSGRRPAAPRGAPGSSPRRPPAGPARTGSRTSCCVSPAPRSTTSGSRATWSSRTPRSKTPSTRRTRSSSTPSTSTRASATCASINSTAFARGRGTGRERHLPADAPGIVPVGQLPRHGERRGRGADGRSRR